MLGSLFLQNGHTPTEHTSTRLMICHRTCQPGLLLQERARAKDLCCEYNQIRPSDEQEQQKIMKRLLDKTKGAFCIVAPFWCDYGYNIEAGENFFANHNAAILDGAKVTFDGNVFVAPTAVFTRQVIPLISSVETKGWSMPIPLQ